MVREGSLIMGREHVRAASGPSSSTARCSLQAMESRADRPGRKVATVAYALKTQALVSVPFCIFAEVSLQCMLHCVYRCIPVSGGGS